MVIDHPDPLQAVPSLLQQPAHIALPPPQHACTVTGELSLDGPSYNTEQLAVETNTRQYTPADAVAKVSNKQCLSEPALMAEYAWNVIGA
ncbi:uncharacterized protein N0V89_003059 [Didymosphaeria variabile]|uniref:Uncharacterized protein n=1 Tax=Didymosphaeria variabile TaxID=1932322 RepID=A0A9W9CF05_9PLEO|nr:uncharacterized protein N0V89_003059 [Didymosphaeria variabile]KAJ4358475.1 hypothetical protein N0V89_003059 [Didymosphaeria variabile]